jgi:putative spermidine/putrescine transport system substrate-binding protein
MRKHLLTGVLAAAEAATSMVALTTTSQAASINYSTCTDLKSCGGMDALVKAAQKEGTLNAITLPRTWANYGEAMDTFSKAFGIKIIDDNPDGSSGYEIQTIKTAPAKKVPDQTDIGITYGQQNENLFASYKPATWKDITPEYKNPDGRWVGSYAGAIAFLYPKSLTKAPTSIADLKDPAFKGAFAMGDPTSAQEALISVFAINQAAGGTFDDMSKGLEFIKALKASGNYVTVAPSATTFAAGAYKVVLTWDFNCPGIVAKYKAAGVDMQCAIPSDANIVGTPYVTGIPLKAPHPAVARLWTEFLYSQNKGKISSNLGSTKGKTGSQIFNSLMGGQNIWITGGAHPITEPAMIKKGLNVAPPTAVLPSSMKSSTPTPAQQDAAKKAITAVWPTISSN